MGSGWKKIKEMIETGNFGDVKKRELINYVETEGFIVKERGAYTRVFTQDGRRLSNIVMKRTIRKDQLLYILRQIGRR